MTYDRNPSRITALRLSPFKNMTFRPFVLPPKLLDPVIGIPASPAEVKIMQCRSILHPGLLRHSLPRHLLRHIHERSLQPGSTGRGGAGDAPPQLGVVRRPRRRAHDPRGRRARSSSALPRSLPSIFIGWMFLDRRASSEVGHAIFRKGWQGFWLDLLSGVLTLVAGLFILLRPIGGSGAPDDAARHRLPGGGIFRIVAGIAMKNPYRGWFILHGVISLVLGGLILADWPKSALWVIGTFVAIDLLVSGLRMVSFGLEVKKFAPIGGMEERRTGPTPRRAPRRKSCWGIPVSSCSRGLRPRLAEPHGRPASERPATEGNQAAAPPYRSSSSSSRIEKLGIRAVESSHQAYVLPRFFTTKSESVSALASSMWSHVRCSPR